MTDKPQAAVEQPFISHLLELRDRLLRMVIVVLVLLLILFPLGNDIFTILSQPVADALPEGSSMLATKVLSPFLTPLKLAFVASLFIAMPYLLYQLWGFVSPGLYTHEKRLAVPMLASSIVLFYLGAAFAYFVVLPLLFPFLVGVVPENVEVAPDIADYLDVAIKLFFAFGLAFEVPIATILLVITGMSTPEQLREKRPYIIVGAFLVGMLLTPPDVISQTLLALPMWILFEFGVFFSSGFVKRKKEREKAEEESEQTPADAGEAAAVAATEEARQHETPSETAEVTTDATSKVDSDSDDFEPMTEDEMEAELDRIEEEEYYGDEDDDLYSDHDDHSGDGDRKASDEDPVDIKLAQVMEYREEENEAAARALLYEVLEEGDETQQKVARNILVQMDSQD